MRICKRCDKEFTPTKVNQQVCDNPHFSVCENCGKSFSWSKRKKTCSTVCTAELRKKNSKTISCQWEGCNGSFPNNGRTIYCDKEHTKTCESCGNEFTVVNMNKISRSCSQSCASALSHNDSSRKNRKDNSLKKYGTEFVTQADSVKKKIKDVLDNDSSKDFRIGSKNFSQTIKEKYGVDNVSSADEIKQKKVQSSLLKYGVDNPMQSKEVKDRFNKSIFEKYNTDFSSLGHKYFKNNNNNFTSPSQIHIKNFSEWKSFDKWVVDEYNKTGKLLNVEEVANYFNVHPLTILGKKNKNLLQKYFEASIVSKKEKKFIEFVEQNFPDLRYKRNDRTVIYPKELDFFFPDHNLAVEISPTSTHFSLDDSLVDSEILLNYSGWSTPKDSDYHLQKLLKCEEKGIELITVFDWMPWDKVVEMISHKLMNASRKIYARKTKVNSIVKNPNNKFSKSLRILVNDWHVLGFNSRGTDFYTYLEYDDEVVAVACWGKPRTLNIRSLKNKSADSRQKDNTYELVRMCFKPGFSVPGGASKLLKNFLSYMKESNNQVDKLITFSDNDLGSGNIYSTIGFEMINVPQAGKNYVNPFYIKNNSTDELFRIKDTSLHFAGADRLLKNFPGYESVGMECKCADEFHENGSCLPNNEQIVLSYGFLPVYDCGYKKWEYIVN